MSLTPNTAHYESRGAIMQKLSLGWILAGAALVLLAPDDALAQGLKSANTLGDLICNVKTNAEPYKRILGAVAYISGAFMMVRGILMLKKQGENPNDPQTVKAVAHLFAAGALLAFPQFVGVIQRTLFGQGSAAGKFGCDPSSSSGIGEGGGLDLMMQRLVKDVHKPMFVLLSAISVITGLTLIFRGLMRGAKTGTDPRAADPKAIVANWVIGAILIAMGTSLPMIMKSIFGESSISNMNSASLIQWSNIVGSGVSADSADKTMKAVLAFVQIIGGISFLRGWLMVKGHLEGGQPPLAQGMTHIIGGALAINIDKALQIMDKTLGTGVIKG